MSAVKSENGTLVTGAGGAKRKKDPLSQATNFAKKVLPKKKIIKKQPQKILAKTRFLKQLILLKKYYLRKK
jgi:hypothetical protein